MTPTHILLQNSSNLRDLGGWPVAGGGRVKTGLVFRAPALVDLTAEDQAVIARLGLTTICDFRGRSERLKRPFAIAGATHVSLPIEPSVGAGLRDIMRTGEQSGHLSPADMLEMLGDAYRAYALLSNEQYRALFAHILGDDGLPLLFHCAAGKDRTGFGAALLLTALGVAWPDVVRDYLTTNEHWRRETARDIDMPDEVKNVLLSAHESLLVAAFDAIREKYGTVDSYLTTAIGLDDAARGRLREKLVDPAA